MTRAFQFAAVFVLAGCSAPASPPADASMTDDHFVATDAGAIDAMEEAASDSADASCFLSKVGVYGTCMTTTECAALGKYVSTPGYCPGAADIACCTKAPNVADNPPVPAGWKLMSQSSVTPEMTTWAVNILHDPVGHPMFSTDVKTFGSLLVMARVEWHPPDFQNNTIHRGVTLYQPI